MAYLSDRLFVALAKRVGAPTKQELRACRTQQQAWLRDGHAVTLFTVARFRGLIDAERYMGWGRRVAASRPKYAGMIHESAEGPVADIEATAIASTEVPFPLESVHDVETEVLSPGPELREIEPGVFEVEVVPVHSDEGCELLGEDDFAWQLEPAPVAIAPAPANPFAAAMEEEPDLYAMMTGSRVRETVAPAGPDLLASGFKDSLDEVLDLLDDGQPAATPAPEPARTEGLFELLSDFDPVSVAEQSGLGVGEPDEGDDWDGPLGLLPDEDIHEDDLLELLEEEPVREHHSSACERRRAAGGAPSCCARTLNAA